MHVAVVRGYQSGHTIKTGGFTCAVRTQKSHSLATFDIERNIAQHRTVFVFFADVEDFKSRDGSGVFGSHELSLLLFFLFVVEHAGNAATFIFACQQATDAGFEVGLGVFAF